MLTRAILQTTNQPNHETSKQPIKQTNKHSAEVQINTHIKHYLPKKNKINKNN
jgi:hypothetical protein